MGDVCIYCVEDDESIRELMVYALKTSGFMPRGFSCADDFWSAVETKIPDLILLDIMLPGDDGVSILAKLKSGNRTADLPVIMLTARSAEYDKVKCLDLGADDYITKPFGIMELIARVRALLRRTGRTQATGGGTTLTYKNITLDREGRTVTVDEKPVILTYKEFELLYYLLRNRAIVLTRDQIMEAVWGTDFAGESRTVDMHVKTLRQKLGSAANMLETVRGVGYKMGGEAS